MLFQHIGCIDRSDLIGVLHTLLWWGRGVVPSSRCMVENWLIPPTEGCWSEQGARTGAAGPRCSGKMLPWSWRWLQVVSTERAEERAVMAVIAWVTLCHESWEGCGQHTRRQEMQWHCPCMFWNKWMLGYCLPMENGLRKYFCTVTGYRNSSQAENVLWDICLFYAGL